MLFATPQEIWRNLSLSSLSYISYLLKSSTKNLTQFDDAASVSSGMSSGTTSSYFSSICGVEQTYPWQMSIGSCGHPNTCGAPCKYVRRKTGCREGENCPSCHLCQWSRSGSSEMSGSHSHAKTKTKTKIAIASRLFPGIPENEEEAGGLLQDSSSTHTGTRVKTTRVEDNLQRSQREMDELCQLVAQGCRSVPGDEGRSSAQRLTSSAGTTQYAVQKYRIRINALQISTA